MNSAQVDLTWPNTHMCISPSQTPSLTWPPDMPTLYPPSHLQGTSEPHVFPKTSLHGAGPIFHEPPRHGWEKVYIDGSKPQTLAVSCLFSYFHGKNGTVSKKPSLPSSFLSKGTFHFIGWVVYRTKPSRKSICKKIHEATIDV